MLQTEYLSDLRRRQTARWLELGMLAIVRGPMDSFLFSKDPILCSEAQRMHCLSHSRDCD